METFMTGMDYKIQEVAGRIRELRQISGLTVEEMAQKTDVTVEEYMAYENGSRNMSIAFMYRCVLIFGVDKSQTEQIGGIILAAGSIVAYILGESIADAAGAANPVIWEPYEEDQPPDDGEGK